MMAEHHLNEGVMFAKETAKGDLEEIVTRLEGLLQVSGIVPGSEVGLRQAIRIVEEKAGVPPKARK